MKSYELTQNELETLSDADRKTYKDAMWYCNQEDAAGPCGGWTKGYELLASMGWRRTETRDGIRTFVSLEKPERFMHTAKET